ncbi:ABC transporter permease [Candidatus Poseidoniaceae archaeon]|nr:ABC transporter permease [Candidatus Poseidoniaceae archaeon]
MGDSSGDLIPEVLRNPSDPPTIFGTINSVRRSGPMLRSIMHRDLRLRYHSSILGYLWTLIEPLMLAGAYYTVFIIIRGYAEERYPLWVLSGILIWSMFTKTTRFGVNALVKNASLIQQVYFSRAVLFVANCLTNYLITIMSMLVLIPFIILYDITPNWRLIYVFIGLFLSGVLALGLGFLLSSLNVRYRDVDHLIGFMIRVGFFLSPIMYTMDFIPQKHHWWYLIVNPMAANISIVRSGIQGEGLLISTQSLMISICITLVIFIYGLYVFSKQQSRVVKML